MKKLLYWLSATDPSLMNELPVSTKISRGAMGFAVLLHVMITMLVWGKTFYTWFGLAGIPLALLITLLMLCIDRLIIATPTAITDDPDIDYRETSQIRTGLKNRLWLGLFFAMITGGTSAISISQDAIQNLLLEQQHEREQALLKEHQDKLQQQVQTTKELYEDKKKELDRIRSLKEQAIITAGKIRERELEASWEEAGKLGNGIGQGILYKSAMADAASQTKYNAAILRQIPSVDAIKKLDKQVADLNQELKGLLEPITLENLKEAGVVLPKLESGITSQIRAFVSILLQDLYAAFLLGFLIAALVVVELMIVVMHLIASATTGERLYSQALLLQTRLNSYEQWHAFEQKVQKSSCDMGGDLR